jgi:hypothetical protein
MKRRNGPLDYATAGAALYLIYELIRPGRNTAQVIMAQANSFAMVTHAMVGIHKRDETVVEAVKAMPKDTRGTLEGFLHEADKIWLEAMMIGVDDEA